MQQNIIVVLGYGCHLTEKLDKYLEECALVIGIKKPRNVVFSGGKTAGKTLPGVSEAQVMANYINKCNLGYQPTIMLEEDSITTEQNLRFTKELFCNHAASLGFPKSRDIMIFCDTAREQKIKVLARIIWGFRPNCATHDFTKSPLGRLGQYLIATPLDVIATLVPPIGQLKLGWRRRKIRRS